MRPLGLIAITMTLVCVVVPAAAETTLERLQRTGVAQIGFANEVPYGYRDLSGALTGEAPEIAKHILERLGVERVDGVLTTFGALVPGLRVGRFDIIAAGMYVLPQRCAEIDFSSPTYRIGSGFVVKAGNPHGLHSFRDVAADRSLRLGVMAGAVERGYARAVGVSQDQLVVFPDMVSALAGVRTGRVDVAAGTEATVRHLVSEAGPAVQLAQPFQNPVIDGQATFGYGAFGFREGDDALREAFNRELDAFIGSPEHLALVEPFGFTRRNLPDKTTDTLCGPEARQ